MPCRGSLFSKVNTICGGGQLLVTRSQGPITRVLCVRVPCPSVASPKAQGPSSRVPGSQVSGSQSLVSQSMGAQSPGFQDPRSQDPASQGPGSRVSGPDFRLCLFLLIFLVYQYGILINIEQLIASEKILQSNFLLMSLMS